MMFRRSVEYQKYCLVTAALIDWYPHDQIYEALTLDQISHIRTHSGSSPTTKTDGSPYAIISQFATEKCFF